MTRFKLAMLGFLMAVVMFAATPAHAQYLMSSPANVTLNYTVGESLSISVAPSSLNLTTAQQILTPTVTYNLATTRAHFGVIAYFASTAALINGTGDTIPSSSILTQVVGPAGSAEMPCTQTPSGLFVAVGTPGASCASYYLSTGGAVGFNGTTSANTFGVRLSAAPTTVGSYAGTLSFLAVSQ